METPINFKQDDYTITKIRADKHSKEMERTTEHITNIILEIALLKTEIDIKVNNLVKVHLNELEELRLKKYKMRYDFLMLREGFEGALAS